MDKLTDFLWMKSFHHYHNDVIWSKQVHLLTVVTVTVMGISYDRLFIALLIVVQYTQRRTAKTIKCKCRWSQVIVSQLYSQSWRMFFTVKPFIFHSLVAECSKNVLIFLYKWCKCWAFSWWKMGDAAQNIFLFFCLEVNSFFICETQKAKSV